VKNFLLVVALSVGSGLAIRYLRHRHHDDDAPKPAPTPVAEVTPQPVPPPPPASDPVPPPPPAPPAPTPPRIAGSIQVSDAMVTHFAVAAGVIYYCDGHSVMAQATSGGPPHVVADCEGAFDFTADAQGVFYCNDHHLMRITAGTEGSHEVAEGECIVEALDAKYVYYIVPGFEGVENPGVYRVARVGGTPEKIHTTQPKEQFMLVNDDDALWIGAWGAGTISKLAKTPHAVARTVVTGQKGIVSFALDPTYVYWYVQTTTEVRRRKRTGGAVEVVGHGVDQEPVSAVDGHVYWFETAGEDKRLVHLAPGAAKPEILASNLKTPSLRVDVEGVYISELDRDGIFMIKR
jgi:hypothetical protein